MLFVLLLGFWLFCYINNIYFAFFYERPFLGHHKRKQFIKNNKKNPHKKNKCTPCATTTCYLYSSACSGEPSLSQSGFHGPH